MCHRWVQVAGIYRRGETYDSAREIEDESQRIDDNNRNPRDGGGKDARQAHEHLNYAPDSYKYAVPQGGQQIAFVAVAPIAINVIANGFGDAGEVGRGAQHDAGADEQPDARDEEANLDTLHCGGGAVWRGRGAGWAARRRRQETKMMMVDERRTKAASAQQFTRGSTCPRDWAALLRVS